MTSAFLSPDEIRKILRFDPDTGKLFWLPRDRSYFQWDRSWKMFQTRYEGKEALTTPIHANSDCYYLCGRIFSKTYHAHRVAFAITYGYWPETVDHINGDGTDNRLCNLRGATRAQNQANMRPRRGKLSCLPKGVTHSGNGTYIARIRRHGKETRLGTFRTPHAAAEAYRAEAERLNGEFAYHNRTKAPSTQASE